MKILIEESTLRQALDELCTQRDAHYSGDYPAELREAITTLRTALDAAEGVEPVAWLYYEHEEECFGHPDGYRPDNAVALYSLEGIKK